MNISDSLLEAFAMESTWLRSQRWKARRGDSGKGASPPTSRSIFQTHTSLGVNGQPHVIGASYDEAAAEQSADVVRRLAAYKAVYTVVLRRWRRGTSISSERSPF